MEQSNRYDGVHPRAVQFIRYHARQLARLCAVPGMDVSDYEQDLVADLLERSDRFDPSRSSYPTFADRLIRKRVASLLESGSRMRCASAGDHDGHAAVDAALETEGLWPTSRLQPTRGPAFVSTSSASSSSCRTDFAVAARGSWP
jgi:hypothetical protein